jgi:hypothetical protein
MKPFEYETLAAMVRFLCKSLNTPAQLGYPSVVRVSEAFRLVVTIESYAI